MANYTTLVRSICESFSDDRSLTPTQYIMNAAPKIFEDYPIFDEAYRAELNKKILRHYYFREIGLETYGLWKEFLNRRMEEIMPYYNQLYASEAVKYNPLWDTDYTTTHNLKNDVARAMQRKENTSKTDIGNEDTTFNESSTENQKMVADEEYSGKEDKTWTERGTDSGNETGEENGTYSETTSGTTSGKTDSTTGVTTSGTSVEDTKSDKNTSGKADTTTAGKSDTTTSGKSDTTTSGKSDTESETGKTTSSTGKDTVKGGDTKSAEFSENGTDSSTASGTVDTTVEGESSSESSGTNTDKETQTNDLTTVTGFQGHIGETTGVNTSSDETTTSNSDRTNRYSDTPQGGLEGIESNEYLTNATLEGINAGGTTNTTGTSSTTHEADTDNQTTEKKTGTLTIDKSGSTSGKESGTTSTTTDTDTSETKSGKYNKSGSSSEEGSHNETTDKTLSGTESGTGEEHQTSSGEEHGTTSGEEHQTSSGEEHGTTSGEEHATGKTTGETSGKSDTVFGETTSGSSSGKKDGTTKTTSEKNTSSEYEKSGDEGITNSHTVDNHQTTDIINSRGNVGNRKNQYTSDFGLQGTEDNQRSENEDYWQTVVGKMGTTPYPDMIMKWRESFLNIDMMIINDLSDLFMLIW